MHHDLSLTPGVVYVLKKEYVKEHGLKRRWEFDHTRCVHDKDICDSLADQVPFEQLSRGTYVLLNNSYDVYVLVFIKDIIDRGKDHCAYIYTVDRTQDHWATGSSFSKVPWYVKQSDFIPVLTKDFQYRIYHNHYLSK